MEFMNFHELYEADWGAAGGFLKFLKNYLCKVLFYVHFASYPSYFQLCEAVGGFSRRSSLHFMNFMKIYEGGVFNGFFSRWLFPAMDFMKLEKGVTSYIFIKCGSEAG